MRGPSQRVWIRNSNWANVEGSLEPTQLSRKLMLTMNSPLHCLPMLLKDDIATQDNMETTAGSWALFGSRVNRDGGVAAKLRAAGVVFLGKANMGELSAYRTLNDTASWSAFGGQVYGAYYPQMDPGGASAGSAVAASIGLAFGALATGLNSAITSPADSNNIVAIHPTVGLTSRDLVVEIGGNEGTVGPMGRTVKDVAYMLQAMAGPDPRDNYTSVGPFASGKTPNYVAACNSNALQGKRIGVPRNTLLNFTQFGYAESNAFEASLNVLRQAGAIIVDNTNYTAFDQYIDSVDPLTIGSLDFKATFQNYLKQLSRNPNNIQSVQDLLNFTQKSPLEDYPAHGTDGFEEVLAIPFNNTSPQYWTAYQNTLFLGGDGGILGALKKYNLDAMVLPTAWSATVSALVGAPVISVPQGALPSNTTVQKLYPNFDVTGPTPNYPFGLAFLGPRFSEELLIGLAYAFEQKTQVRQKIKPYLAPKTELKDVLGM